MKEDRLDQAEPDEPPDDELMRPHQIISLKGSFWLNEGKQIRQFMDQLLRKPAVITGQLRLCYFTYSASFVCHCHTS